MPVVSIIMNVQNGAATLREAIESVLAQTFTQWELIVWDDCSTDESAAIVASFDDSRIHYLLAPARVSLAEARAEAIKLAHGEWLAFLDQDDIWLPYKLDRQLPLGSSSSVGLIYGRTVAFTANRNERDYDYLHEFGPLPEGNIQAELVGSGCFIAMSSVLLRRSAVTSAMSFPGALLVTPDYALYLSVCGKFEARAVQDVVCRYRVHADSMTGRVRMELLIETGLLVQQYRNAVSPAAYERRTRGIETALAMEEMRHAKTFWEGLSRLLTRGSLLWLAGRPWVHLWRIMRRRIQQPAWKKYASS